MKIFSDSGLLREVASRFDLREPNSDALEAVVEALAGHSDPQYPELVVDLATGVGKTYLMSALIDYIASQGGRNFLVVTPGSTIQRKTLENFDEASLKYVAGADHRPVIITPENFQRASTASSLRDPRAVKVFVFNVQQLLRPTDRLSRRTRNEDENLGASLYSTLAALDDLVVISDEHHLYHRQAREFSAALRQLDPLALIGLTATPAETDLPNIVFSYSLARAIANKHVKVPVIAYRPSGISDQRTQLRDAVMLRDLKEAAYQQYASERQNKAGVHPVIFVVCSSVAEAEETAQLLAGPGFLESDQSVLLIVGGASDEALQQLSDVEKVESPVRAIVSVNMLREGWDVKNVAVIVALRTLASQALTEQILGRGLRLPFGERTGIEMVDSVDLVAHDSYKQLLAQKDILAKRLVPRAQHPSTVSGPDVVDTVAALVTVDDHGAAVVSVAEQKEIDDVVAETSDAVEWDAQAFLVTPESGDDQTDEVLALVSTEARLATGGPSLEGRVTGAPQIVFPKRVAVPSATPFELSSISDLDARRAGERFREEIPTVVARDALESTAVGEHDARVRRVPQQNATASEELAGVSSVHNDLVRAVQYAPEVPRSKSSRNAAERIVTSFLRGAGVAPGDDSASFGAVRRAHAIDGIRSLITREYESRPSMVVYSWELVTLPREPIFVESPLDAYNDNFIKWHDLGNWRRNIMPVARFDAKTTEWSFAHLVDRAQEVEWWLRLAKADGAYINRPDAGAYYPDFIVIDSVGVHWLVETKADDSIQNLDVQLKAEAARVWARSVSDSGEFGSWRYMLVSENHLKNAGSWSALVNLAYTED